MFKVKQLDEKVTTKAGFAKAYMVTGQTYSRKVLTKGRGPNNSISDRKWDIYGHENILSVSL